MGITECYTLSQNQHFNADYGGKVTHMKCNINRTTNNFANVFGPEFDKHPEEIINIIRKVSKLKVIGPGYNPKEVEITLYNNDYYVRPGATRQRFIKEFQEIFAKTKQLEKVLGENVAYIGTTIQLLCLIQKFFDETYFEEQVKQRLSSETISINKDKLRTYLNKLDRNKLESFLNMIVGCRLERGWFITNGSSTNFWAKIHESCRVAGVNIPEALDSLEGQKFLRNNVGFYWGVLDTKVIANMLCDAIDLNVKTATSAAKKLYTSGYPAMMDYIKREVKNNT